ncbi:uncharacterized protein VP01_2649g1 [Puccinia sorghi]|uniref:Uncharacterized protein n=1 Tax=Puccinia sorghi TaxID=27349 RepID=A0A0L6V476_9BASI|nr:uncharacterized protein VP01_2649g1 [Puccinia sorghi]
MKRALHHPFRKGGRAHIMLSRTMPSCNNTSTAHLSSALCASSGPALPTYNMSGHSMFGASPTDIAAQHNWRNGLNSPNTKSLNGPDPMMLHNTLAMMKNTLAGLRWMDMNSIANLAAMTFK